MTAAERNLLKAKLRRRSYPQVNPDPIQDAKVISDKVQNSSCFGAVAAVIVAIVIVAVIL